MDSFVSSLSGKMQPVWEALAACWSTVSLQLLSGLPSHEIYFNNRRFRVLKQLGEGGYSYVYLVRELPSSESGPVPNKKYALKQMTTGNAEQLKTAEQEIEVLRKLKHPHIVSLLDSAVVPGCCGQEEFHTVYMLFPWYMEGTAVDVVQRLQDSGSRFSPYNVLDIFRQICEGVHAMHTIGLAHRDVKPHNVLLERRSRSKSAPNMADPSTSMLMSIPEGSDEDLESPGFQRDATYSAVLTDFGSVGPATVVIDTRQQALALQEEAQAHCSMPYRAPELYDVPSPCTIDDRIDTWSLGCTLYFLMYGISPFESVLNEAGGSLSLAVINGRVNWPKPPVKHYPDELHSLVVSCLDTNPETRPCLKTVIERVKELLKMGLPV